MNLQVESRLPQGSECSVLCLYRTISQNAILFLEAPILKENLIVARNESFNGNLNIKARAQRAQYP